MIYIVTFDTQKNRTTYEHVFFTDAKNAKDAVQIAKDNWKRKEHQFHIHAVKSRLQDVQCLQVNTALSRTCTGSNCMNNFFCTDIIPWLKR